jgi:hypothetical protein
MCFVWISEQAAIISLYSINWTGFYNRDGVRLLRGTDWIYIYIPVIPTICMLQRAELLIHARPPYLTACASSHLHWSAERTRLDNYRWKLRRSHTIYGDSRISRKDFAHKRFGNLSLQLSVTCMAFRNSAPWSMCSYFLHNASRYPEKDLLFWRFHDFARLSFR